MVIFTLSWFDAHKRMSKLREMCAESTASICQEAMLKRFLKCASFFENSVSEIGT